MTEVAYPPLDPSLAGPSSASLPKYEQVAESKHELEWADLVTLDLSQFDAPGGKQRLAEQLREAVQKIGFFYIVNFGLSQDEIDRQFAIGRELFQLPEEEKLKHRADLESGNYNGYRPLGAIELFPGLRDNVEMYNVFKFIPELARSHPAILRDNIVEIERVHRFIHGDIIRKLLTLIAIVLELPEDFLVRTHPYDAASGCHLRYMLYRARSAEANARYQHLYSRGHTDFGSLTLLFRQPVAALQVLTPAGAWRYVKPLPGSITVNIADALQFWTNGFLKSSVHRVVAPPEDQAHLDRLGVLFFLRPSDDLDLKTVPSPVLERLGLRDPNAAVDGVLAGEWVRNRVKNNWNRPREGEKEQEVVKGLKSKFYD